MLYKSEQYGGRVQLVDRWYASSKTCHCCGWIRADLKLANRIWNCEQCGAVNERDLNAALNIRDEALRLASSVPIVVSSGQNSPVEQKLLPHSAKEINLLQGSGYGRAVKKQKAIRLRMDVPVVASSGQKFAGGAGSDGSLYGVSETSCNEAGTKVSSRRKHV